MSELWTEQCILNVTFDRSETDDDNGSLYEPEGRYFDVNKLKETNPHLKTLLSIGGATAGSAPFKEIVKSEDSMRSFTRNAIIYMRDRKFDGIDLDWEYPGEIGMKQEFTQLLQVAWHIMLHCTLTYICACVN